MRGKLSFPKISEEIFARFQFTAEGIQMLDTKRYFGSSWSVYAVLLEVQGLLMTCHADSKPQQKIYTHKNSIKQTYTAVEGQ